MILQYQKAWNTSKKSKKPVQAKKTNPMYTHAVTNHDLFDNFDKHTMKNLWMNLGIKILLTQFNKLS